jgi:Sec-independent protein translocase protein TatA
MGLGTEILLVLTIGFVLGPKRFHTILGQVGRAKAQFEEARRDFKSQLSTEPDLLQQNPTSDVSNELAGNQ